MLMVGPTVQGNRISILLRFCMHVYVMSADIEKMYRQIWIHPSQRDVLKLFGERDNDKSDPEIFKLKIVT